MWWPGSTVFSMQSKGWVNVNVKAAGKANGPEAHLSVTTLIKMSEQYAARIPKYWEDHGHNGWPAHRDKHHFAYRGCDIITQESEVLKQDFIDLLNTVSCVNAEVFISGPLPLVRRGDERFSRLFALNNWLSTTCIDRSIHFIYKFYLFWERGHFF